MTESPRCFNFFFRTRAFLFARGARDAWNPGALVAYAMQSGGGGGGGAHSPDKISSCPYLTRHSGGRSPTNMHNALSVRGTVRGVAVTRREIPCSICGAGAGRAPGKIWNRGYLTRYAACQGHIVKKTNVRIEAKDATRQVGETSGGGRSPANWSSLPI